MAGEDVGWGGQQTEANEGEIGVGSMEFPQRRRRAPHRQETHVRCAGVHGGETRGHRLFFIIDGAI